MVYIFSELQVDAYRVVTRYNKFVFCSFFTVRYCFCLHLFSEVCTYNNFAGPSQALVIYLLSVIISASVLRYYHGPLLSQPQFLPIIVKLIWHFAVTTLNSSIFMVARGKLELERRHKTEFLSRMRYVPLIDHMYSNYSPNAPHFCDKFKAMN